MHVGIAPDGCWCCCCWERDPPMPLVVGPPVAEAWLEDTMLIWLVAVCWAVRVTAAGCWEEEPLSWETAGLMEEDFWEEELGVLGVPASAFTFLLGGPSAMWPEKEEQRFLYVELISSLYLFHLTHTNKKKTLFKWDLSYLRCHHFGLWASPQLSSWHWDQSSLRPGQLYHWHSKTNKLNNIIN